MRGMLSGEEKKLRKRKEECPEERYTGRKPDIPLLPVFLVAFLSYAEGKTEMRRGSFVGGPVSLKERKRPSST